MKRAAVSLLSVLLALLCLLALDDITTGSEPGYAQEWAMVASTACWFAALLWRRRRRA